MNNHKNKGYEMDEKYNWKQVIKNNFILYHMCTKIAPKYMALYVINCIYAVFAVFLEFTYGFNYILECAEFGVPFSHAFRYLIFLFCFVVIGQVFSSWLNEKITLKAMPKIKGEFKKKLYKKAKEVDLQCYDDPDFYNEIILAIKEADVQIERIFMLVNKIITSVATLILTGGFFLETDVSSFAFIAVLFCCSYIFNQIYNKMNYQIKMLINPQDRKREYVKRTAYLAEYAKEMRINGELFNIMMDKFKNSNDEIEKIQKKYAMKKFVVSFFKDFITNSLLHNIVYMLYLIYRAVVVKAISYSNVIVLFKAANKVKNNLTTLAMIYPFALETSLYIDRINCFLHIKSSLVNEKRRKVPENPHTLELKHVYFSYSGDDTYILKDINMQITSKSKVALVGFNGAGKTTLIKLIMRLYDITKGEILLDGINIKEYDLMEYRKMIGVIFQDYKLYAATLCENILLDFPDDDKERIIAAMNKSGFYERFKILKYGLDTELTKEFDKEGTNLSGGENQKVALTRLFYRDNPIVILDEPSSALDPISEYKLNNSMLEIGKGKIEIFISHRLSSTRYMEQIYVLENGCIVENGTHKELLDKCGVYSRMWNLQAGDYIFS